MKGEENKNAMDAEEVHKGIEKMYKIYEKLNSATDKTMVRFQFTI